MKRILLLLLINCIFSDTNIILNELEGYYYNPILYGNSTIDITSTGAMDVFIKDGEYTYTYTNTTNCFHEFEEDCSYIIHPSVTITSKVNNNKITMAENDEINCSWISVNGFYVLVGVYIFVSYFIIIPCVMLCCRPSKIPTFEMIIY